MTGTRNIETRTLARGVAVILLVALAVTGCSKKVASDQAGSKEGDRNSGKTALVTSDLADLLPTASNLGPEYSEAQKDDSEDTAAGDNGAFVAAMVKDCPDSQKFMAKGGGKDSLDRVFDTKDGRQVEVNVQIEDADAADRELEDIRNAFANCKTVKYTDDAKVKYSIKLGGKADQTYGDNGAMLTMDRTITDPHKFKPVTIRTKMRLFRVGNVDVTISARSGYNHAAEAEVDGDFDLLDSLADTIASGAKDLQK